MTFTRRNIGLILGFTAIVQAAIILYNASTGFITIGSPAAFVMRLLIGTALSAPVAFAIVAIDAFIVHTLDRYLLWEERLFVRIAAETVCALLAGVVLGAAITAAVQMLLPYRDGLWKNLVTNALITAVLNLIILACVEAVIAYTRGKDARRKADTLERENARIRFETLKTQLNPHFMFNSLNVLSSLIRKDASRAEEFIDQFASVYRYTLDVIDRPVVELARELEFAHSYLFLLGIRFENAVVTHIRVSEEHLEMLVPPLSIQVVLENAFKHNKVSEETPLCLRIESSGRTLTISNTLRPKHIRAEESRGVGLSNLRKRYEYLGGAAPEFRIVDSEFVATLPLIVPE